MLLAFFAIFVFLGHFCSVQSSELIIMETQTVVNPLIFTLASSIQISDNTKNLYQMCAAIKYCEKKKIPFLEYQKYHTAVSTLAGSMLTKSEKTIQYSYQWEYTWHEWLSTNMCDIVTVMQLKSEGAVVTIPSISENYTIPQVLEWLSHGANILPYLEVNSNYKIRFYLDELAIFCLYTFQKLDDMLADASMMDNTFISNSISSHIMAEYMGLNNVWINSPFVFMRDIMRTLGCPSRYNAQVPTSQKVIALD